MIVVQKQLSEANLQNRISFQPNSHAFQIPRAVRFEIARPHLIEFIERESESKLIALVAPAGYGKTTILAQYARATSYQVMWLTLGSEAADITFLAKNVQVALHNSQNLKIINNPEIYESIASITDKIQRILGNADKSIRLIFDHVEHLSPESGAWLEHLIRQMPEGHQVIISGYEFSLPRLANMISRGEASVIELKQLTFTLDETAAYLEARGFDGSVEQAYKALEGWPAGVGLIAANLVTQALPDDLISEVFKAIPERIRQTLPEACILDIWQEETATQAALELPADWLDVVRRSGLPITPLGHRAYRPHSVLQNFLHKLLANRPERYSFLLSWAATQAESRGDVLTALNNYRAAGLLAEALRVAEKLVTFYEDRLELTMSYRILEKFDLKDLPVHLAASYGFALGEIGRLEQADRLLTRLHLENPDHPHVCFCLAVFRGIQGFNQEVLTLAEQGLAQNPSEPWLGRLLRLKATKLSWFGQTQLALEIIKEAIHTTEEQNDMINLGKNSLVYADMCYRNNDFKNAKISVEKSVQIFEFLQIPMQANLAYQMLGSIFFKQEKLEKAFENVAKAESILSKEDYSFDFAQRSRLYDLKGDIHFWAHQYIESLSCYQKALLNAQELGDFFIQATIQFQIFDVLQKLQRFDEAHLELQKANRIPLQQNGGVEPIARFFNGLYEFTQAHYDEAKLLFMGYFSSNISGLRRLRAQLYLSEIARIQGDLEFTHFQKILEYAQEFSIADALHLDQQELAGLYTEFHQRGWQIEGLQVANDNQKLEVCHFGTQFKLEILSFGKGIAKINGLNVKFPFAKTIEILVWLALNGPASREFVVDAVWDGSRDQKDAEYARVSLRKLRMALIDVVGDVFNPLPYKDGQYKLASEFVLTLDCKTLESLSLSQDIDELKLALELIRQPFLQGITSEWVEEYRTKLNETALLVSLNLGALLKSQPLESIKVYRRALEIDPLCEDAHLALIKAFESTGDFVAAKRSYQKYAQMLSEEMGLEPNRELQQSYGR